MSFCGGSVFMGCVSGEISCLEKKIIINGKTRIGWCISNALLNSNFQLRKVGRCVADLPF